MPPTQAKKPSMTRVRFAIPPGFCVGEEIARTAIWISGGAMDSFAPACRVTGQSRSSVFVSMHSPGADPSPDDDLYTDIALLLLMFDTTGTAGIQIAVLPKGRITLTALYSDDLSMDDHEPVLFLMTEGEFDQSGFREKLEADARRRRQAT